MPTKNLPEGVHFFDLRPENVTRLWFQFQKTNGIFDDMSKGDINAFIVNLTRKDAVWLELDDEMGVLYATDIIVGLSANVHIAFFDHNLRDRYPLIVDCLAWIANACALEKVNAGLPSFARVARRHVKSLGFQEEGVIRRFSRSNGQLYDLHIYGIFKENIMTHELLRR
jgi:hypothetical protein